MGETRNVPRMSTTLAIVFAALVSAPSEALADHVVLRNSDSLTGGIAAASKAELAIDTELAGRVTIKWSAVSRVTSTTSVRAILANGRTVEGAPVMSDGRLSLQQTNGTTASVDLTTVRTLDVANTPAGAPSCTGHSMRAWT
jgi:hypothetical protein